MKTKAMVPGSAELGKHYSFSGKHYFYSYVDLVEINYQIIKSKMTLKITDSKITCCTI